MQLLRVFLILSFFTLCWLQTSFAEEAPDYAIHQEYTSTRALGMGNAFSAVVDDHSALFYNPAALALRKDSQFRMFLRGGANPEYNDFVDELDSAGDDPDKVSETIEKYYGEHMYSRVPTLGGILVRPKWGFAILPVDLSTDLTPHFSLGPSVFVNSYLDTTIAFGRAGFIKNVKKGKLMYGWSAKAIYRAQYTDVVQSVAIIQNDDDIVDINKAKEGVTVDADVGFLYQVDSKKRKFLAPTISFVARNIFDYGFPIHTEVFNNDADEPARLQRRFDLGSKWDLPTFWVFDPKIAIDIRDMGHKYWTPMKGFHAGAEMYWKMYNWWKGHWSVGLNQGYWTAGFGARLGIFQLDLASWGEEVGTTDAKAESRRYIMEMSLDF